MEDLNTKQKGDIAEQAAILQALRRGWGVLHPVGDRLPYDLVFDLDLDLAEIDLFYVIPVDVFLSYKSGISLVEAARRQRKPRSAGYRDAWGLIVDWAAARSNGASEKA